VDTELRKVGTTKNDPKKVLRVCHVFGGDQKVEVITPKAKYRRWAGDSTRDNGSHPLRRTQMQLLGRKRCRFCRATCSVFIGKPEVVEQTHFSGDHAHHAVF